MKLGDLRRELRGMECFTDDMEIKVRDSESGCVFVADERITLKVVDGEFVGYLDTLCQESAKIHRRNTQTQEVNAC